MPFSPEHYLAPLRDALYGASRVVAELYRNRRFETSTKDDSTPLTSADLAANEILREALGILDPDAGWLSEENEDSVDRLRRERVWIVDPIDGTREFIEQTGGYSISAGLAVNGVPELGGVALPEERLIVIGARGSGLQIWRYDEAGQFEAVSGGLGATGSGSLAKRLTLASARILVSLSEWKRGAFESVAEDLRWEPTGSIARKLALVAMGRADLVVSLFPKNEWDICGGAALILCQPGSAMVALEDRQPRPFNRPAPRSIGLAAGSAALVGEFCEFIDRKKLKLHSSYD